MLASPAKRIIRSILCLVIAFPSIVPAYSQEERPYFRFQAGGDPDGEQGIRINGPTGEYVIRIGRRLTLPAPTANADPVTWTASGSYPNGLTVDPDTGAVSGNPMAAGRFGGLSVTAHQARKNAQERTGTYGGFALTVLDLPITVSYASTVASANSQFRLSPKVTNVSSQAEYRISAGLPAGLTMSKSTGVIQGTVTGTSGATGLVVTVKDADGEEQSSLPFNIGISQTQASLTINSDGTGVEDFPYTNKILSKGLTAPIRYEVDASGGRLPNGIVASASPVDSLSGRATESGTFPNIVVIATDAHNISVPSPPFSLSFGKPAISYPTTSQVVGKSFSISPILANIKGAVFQGVQPMPDGLSVDPATGLVYGRISQVGSTTFQVSARNDGGTYTSKPTTINGSADSYLVRTESRFVQAHVGYPVDTGFSATSSAAPVTWVLSGSALPDGLVLGKSSGRITGTSYAATSVAGVRAQAIDTARTAVESDDVTFQILPLPTMPASETYAAPLGKRFENQFRATNLIGTGSYAVADEASLPPGITVSPGGLLSGTPTAVGIYPGIVVTVVDARDKASARSAPFTMTVRDTGTDLAVDNVAGLYRVRQSKALAMPAPMALNATAPVTWSISSESAKLPTGLTLDPATGIVSGNPSVIGTTSSLRLQLADASGRPPVVSPYFAIEVAPPLQIADVSSSYAIRIASAVEVLPTAIGRIGDATWELSGGVLPQALAFDPRLGRIAGAPLVSGRIPVTPPALRAAALAASAAPSSSPGYVLKVTDSFDGAVATSPPFDFVVGSGIVIVAPSSYKATVGLDFTTSGTYSVKGAEGQLAWSIASGVLPDGLRLDGGTGIISGKPTAASIAYGLRLQATDMANNVSGTSAPFTISVSGGLQPQAPAIAYAHVNKAFAYLKPSVTGNQGAVRWSLAAGGLPPGLSLNPSTGWVFGTPTAAGTFTNIRLGASDAAGQVGVTSEITLVVNDNPTWASPPIRIPTSRYDTVLGPYPAPVIQGAVGKVTFSKGPPGRSVWGSDADFTIDPDTGVINGKMTGKAYNSDFMYSGWMIATDETGSVANSPGTEIFAGLRPLAFGDCDFFNGDGVCWTNARAGFESVVTPQYFTGVLGALRFSFVPGKEPPDWVKLDPSTGFVHGIPPAAGDYPYSMRITDIDGATADRKRAFHVIAYDKPTDTPERVTLTVRYGASQVFDPLVPPVTDPAGGTVKWEAWGGWGFPLDTQPNGGSLKATWTGGYRYGLDVGVQKGFTVRATGSDGTVLSTTAVDFNVLPQLAIGNATNVCVRYGETFDTGPRVAGNLYGTARWESWWNSSPYNGLDPFINFDPATGRLSGTAPNSDYGNYFEPRLYDTYDNASTYAPNSRQFINVYAPLSLAPPDVLTVRERDTYSPRMRYSGGAWDGTLYVADGNLPPGVYMDRYGYFGGTATQQGSYTFKVGFTPRTCGAPDMFTMVTVVVTPPGLPYLQVPDTMYFRQGLLSRSPDPKVIGQGTETYRWASFGAILDGLGVDAGSGAVYGVPTQSGIFDGRRIYASDTKTYRDMISNYIKVVVLPPPTLTMPPSTTLIVGQPARIAPTASGFVGSVTWTGTAMPPGLSVDPADGAVTGVPTALGTTDKLAVRGSETGTAGLDTAGNPVPAAGMTSNAFAITVVDRPLVRGVSDMTGTVNNVLTMQPVGVNVGPSPRWSLYGDIHAGFTIDPATGKVSGSSPVPLSASLFVVVTDTVTGYIGTSARFRITVDPATKPALPTTWTWDRQICTYASAPGEFSGRQLQVCSGDDCPTTMRGCKAPYAGGESSYPVGLTATECLDPTLPPNEGFCPTDVPTDGAKGTWRYTPVGTQPSPETCITVTDYKLGCFVDGDANPKADGSVCGAPPTNVSECKLNDKGKGSCTPGITLTDGRNVEGFDDGSTWYTTDFCPISDGILLDVLWVTSVNGVEVAVVREPGSDYSGPFLNRGWFDAVGAPYKIEPSTRNILVFTLTAGSGTSQYVTRTVPAIRATRAAIDRVYALAKQYTFQDVHGIYDGGAADIHNGDLSDFASAVRSLGGGVHGPARGVGVYGLVRCVPGSICVHETSPAVTNGPGPQAAAWKYAANGHVENTCTAGASVYELVPGCYVGDRQVDAGQCPQAGAPPYPSCKVWPKNASTVGVEGNCPTGYPEIGLPFAQQKVEYASVGFMYDYKGTCRRSEITPYR